MFSLRPTVLTDAYTYFDCPRASYIIVNVYNSGVYCGIGKSLSGRSGDAVFPAEDLFLAPGSNPIFGADRLRFRRSDSTSTATTVTAQASLENDLPRDIPITGVYTPNYLTIDPLTGRVSADFSGHISALGIDLPPAPTDSPSGDNRVNWIRDGSTVYSGLIYVSDAGSRNQRMQLGLDPFQSPHPFAGTPTTGIDILHWPRTGKEYVRAFTTTGRERSIIEANGASDFVQILSATRPNLTIQYTRRNVVVPAGASTQFFNLPLGFPAAHLAFLAWVRVAAGASTTMFRSAPNTLSQGFADLNSTIAQNVIFDIIAIGQ